MTRRMLTVSQKLAILGEAEQTGSIEITARKHKLQKNLNHELGRGQRKINWKTQT